MANKAKAKGMGGRLDHLPFEKALSISKRFGKPFVWKGQTFNVNGTPMATDGMDIDAVKDLIEGSNKNANLQANTSAFASIANMGAGVVDAFGQEKESGLANPIAAGASGALRGAGVGAQLGSLFGPVGTVVGGAAGGIFGGVASGLGAQKRKAEFIEGKREREQRERELEDSRSRDVLSAFPSQGVVNPQLFKKGGRIKDTYKNGGKIKNNGPGDGKPEIFINPDGSIVYQITKAAGQGFGAAGKLSDQYAPGWLSTLTGTEGYSSLGKELEQIAENPYELENYPQLAASAYESMPFGSIKSKVPINLAKGARKHLVAGYNKAKNFGNWLWNGAKHEVGEEAAMRGTGARYEMGGRLANPNNIVGTNGGNLQPVAPGVEQVNGPGHPQGGVDLVNKQGEAVANVEGGEMIKDRNDVFSDTVEMEPGVTFADKAREISSSNAYKRYVANKEKLETKAASGDRFAQNTAKRMLARLKDPLDVLFEQQQQMVAEQQAQLPNGDVVQTDGQGQVQGGVPMGRNGLDIQQFNETLSNVAPFSDNLVNSILTARTPNIPEPRLTRPASLRTAVDVNPQLAAIDRASRNRQLALERSTSSGSELRANLLAGTAADINARNQVLGQKTNMETQLVNQAALNRQQTGAANNALLNQADKDRLGRSLGIQSQISANASNLVEDIRLGQQQRNQSKLDKQRLALVALRLNENGVLSRSNFQEVLAKIEGGASLSEALSFLNDGKGSIDGAADVGAGALGPLDATGFATPEGTKVGLSDFSDPSSLVNLAKEAARGKERGEKRARRRGFETLSDRKLPAGSRLDAAADEIATADANALAGLPLTRRSAEMAARRPSARERLFNRGSALGKDELRKANVGLATRKVGAPVTTKRTVQPVVDKTPLTLSEVNVPTPSKRDKLLGNESALDDNTLRKASLATLTRKPSAQVGTKNLTTTDLVDNELTLPKADIQNATRADNIVQESALDAAGLKDVVREGVSPTVVDEFQAALKANVGTEFNQLSEAQQTMAKKLLLRFKGQNAAANRAELQRVIDLVLKV